MVERHGWQRSTKKRWVARTGYHVLGTKYWVPKKTGDGANVPRKVTAEQQTPNQRLGLPWSGSLHAPGKNRCVILTLHTLTGLFSNCK